MNSIMKLSVALVTGLVAVSGISLSAQAAGPYSCSDSTYGGSYSSCSTNNTANQSSTVATATTVLRTASTQTAGLVANRVSSALGGAGGVQVASNGFSAETGMSAGDMGGKLGAWVSGSWTDVEDENSDTAYDGNVWTGMAGVDYKVTDMVVLGLSAGWENADIDTDYNGFGSNDGNIEGDGYTIAPYVGVEINDMLNANLVVGYSDITYDTVRYDPNTGNRISGSTDATRYFTSAALNGVQPLVNNFVLKGRLGAFYATEDKDAFTETEAVTLASITQASEDNELGQATLDARLAYALDFVEPYALVGAEYDFVKDDVTVAAGQTVSDDDFGMKFGGGVNLINMGGSVTGGVEAYTVEFRDDYSEVNVNAGVRVKF